ncbi:MAG: ABC transporter permease [Clostridiales bacterium]|nr:ABC transporter permease [Clostridiales bacterium]
MRGKRGSEGLTRYSSALSSLLAIIAGLLIGFVILIVANPKDAISGFGMLAFSAMGDLRTIGQVLFFATPIIMTGLAVGFAGKTGLFNIGASGQFVIGAYFAVLVSVKLSFLPGVLLVPVAILAAMLGGAVWGMLPGILKAYRNVHEVISCIMMNYIGMYLVNYLIPISGIYNKLRNETVRLPENANLPKIGLDLVFAESDVNSGILIAILAAIAIYVILQKTKLGYELKACGYNKNAARYAGINANMGMVTAMIVSGALAGLGGALLYMAGSGKCIKVLDMLAPEGFNGIPVALLALNNPIGVIFSGLFISYLTVGGFNLQALEYPVEVVDMIVSIIIYFSAFSLLVKGYIDMLGKRGKRGRGDVSTNIDPGPEALAEKTGAGAADPPGEGPPGAPPPFASANAPGAGASPYKETVKGGDDE